MNRPHMASGKCLACSRKALPGNVYCINHSEAYEGLQRHYKAWVDAYGIISMQEFMDKLAGMKETGSWVKEVIQAERARMKL